MQEVLSLQRCAWIFAPKRRPCKIQSLLPFADVRGRGADSVRQRPSFLSPFHGPTTGQGPLTTNSAQCGSSARVAPCWRPRTPSRRCRTPTRTTSSLSRTGRRPRPRSRATDRRATSTSAGNVPARSPQFRTWRRTSDHREAPIRRRCPIRVVRITANSGRCR
jgi:hypothetical protein